ncbi:MAG: BamA/TamA family outer membrane protein [Candidatus Eisenbacteria bacterium]|nr:BamA/TamA family outer membrane protein [Candidatus Eisenbacteria bacterium]
MLLAFAVPARAASDFPSELQSVDQIRFEGRHEVPEKDLLAAMKTRRPSMLPWRERPILRLDFLRADTVAIVGVYRQNGFLDATASSRVRTLRDVNRAEVTFMIHEGERSLVQRIEFSGVRVYPEAQLRQKLYSKHGRPFNPSALIADTSRISEAYQERGYLPHVTTDTTRRGSAVTCTYDVTEGPLYRFGQVYWSSPGAITVKRSLIDRELDVKPGEIYRRSRIQRTVERLYSTDLFRSIQVTPLPDSANALMELDMRLEERKRHWIDAGIGSGSYERFNVSGAWGHRNLLNKGLATSVNSRLSLDKDWYFQQWRNELSVGSPWVFATRLAGQVTGYYYQSDDRVSDPRWILHQWAPGIRFQVRREFSRVLKLTATQDNVYVRQSVTFLIPDPDPALVDSLFANVPPEYVTHLFNLTLDRELRDDLLNTTHGSAQSISGEIAGGPLKGSSSYLKGQAGASKYWPVRRFWVLAAQVRAGAAAPFGTSVQFTAADSSLDPEVASVPLANRFRLGGVNSVRGFDENTLAPNGGLAMVQANLELRVPLMGPFGVEFYVDAGNIWPGASDIHLSDFKPYAGPKPVEPGEVRYVFGLGPRLNLPFGPLRLDITWSPRPVEPGTHNWYIFDSPPSVQFAIGPSF